MRLSAMLGYYRFVAALSFAIARKLCRGRVVVADKPLAGRRTITRQTKSTNPCWVRLAAPAPFPARTFSSTDFASPLIRYSWWRNKIS